ncbi:uncharacterized protein J3D65DRAFT_604729 [Phyllosticta citribraziliensis]|uniref:GATA-type domain-containing protein n=1 Tax=Phyllosticta citribraziliensis TaxID=989973 RepID=A0ABR1LJI0_9PEZI
MHQSFSHCVTEELGPARALGLNVAWSLRQNINRGERARCSHCGLALRRFAGWNPIEPTQIICMRCKEWFKPHNELRPHRKIIRQELELHLPAGCANVHCHRIIKLGMKNEAILDPDRQITFQVAVWHKETSTFICKSCWDYQHRQARLAKYAGKGLLCKTCGKTLSDSDAAWRSICRACMGTAKLRDGRGLPHGALCSKCNRILSKSDRASPIYVYADDGTHIDYQCSECVSVQRVSAAARTQLLSLQEDLERIPTKGETQRCPSEAILDLSSTKLHSGRQRRARPHDSELIRHDIQLQKKMNASHGGIKISHDIWQNLLVEESRYL